MVLALIIFGWDLYQKRMVCVACSDGKHCRIDMRDFVTTHSVYSVELEATLGRRKDFSGRLKIDPVQLTSLSESLQRANEFRKYLVAGYNSCAIRRRQGMKLAGAWAFSRSSSIGLLVHVIV